MGGRAPSTTRRRDCRRRRSDGSYVGHTGCHCWDGDAVKTRDTGAPRGARARAAIDPLPHGDPAHVGRRDARHRADEVGGRLPGGGVAEDADQPHAAVRGHVLHGYAGLVGVRCAQKLRVAQLLLDGLPDPRRRRRLCRRRPTRAPRALAWRALGAAGMRPVAGRSGSWGSSSLVSASGRRPGLRRRWLVTPGGGSAGRAAGGAAGEGAVATGRVAAAGPRAVVPFTQTTITPRVARTPRRRDTPRSPQSGAAVALLGAAAASARVGGIRRRGYPGVAVGHVPRAPAGDGTRSPSPTVGAAGVTRSGGRIRRSAHRPTPDDAPSSSMRNRPGRGRRRRRRWGSLHPPPYGDRPGAAATGVPLSKSGWPPRTAAGSARRRRGPASPHPFHIRARAGRLGAHAARRRVDRVSTPVPRRRDADGFPRPPGAPVERRRLSNARPASPHARVPGPHWPPPRSSPLHPSPRPLRKPPTPSRRVDTRHLLCSPRTALPAREVADLRPKPAEKRQRRPNASAALPNCFA
jgi:hypothetical protein